MRYFFIFLSFFAVMLFQEGLYAAPSSEKDGKKSTHKKAHVKKAVVSKTGGKASKSSKIDDKSKEDASKKKEEAPATTVPTLPADPQKESPKEIASGGEGSPGKLPIPRFVSFKANAVNMHVGPGNNYPIEWRYIKQSLPVEVVAEFEHWRQVRDAQGTVGWVHKTLLSSKRFTIVQGKVANLYSSADLESKVLATIEPGVVCKISECINTMCKVDIQGIKGWVKRDLLWGIYPHEQVF